MATANNKNAFARTYSRHLKPKEEVLPVPSSGEIPIEYENACRLCLEKAPVMMDMFRYQDCLIPIIVKIRSIIALEVNEDDEMPKLICEHCLIQLNEAYTFKKRCLASDAKLRQCLFSRWLPKGVTCPNTEEWSNDNRLCLVEEKSSLDNKKNRCTIDWNDHVPLATIIENLPNDKNENLPYGKSLDSYFDMKESNKVGGSSVRVEPEVNYEIEVDEFPNEDDGSEEPHEIEAVEITNDPEESHEDLTSKEKQLPPPEQPELYSIVKKKKKKKLRRPHPKTEAVGNRRTENLTKQMVHQQIPDARIQRKLTAVNIEDVPLAARLKLERGKGATKLIKTISDIKTEDKPTEKIKYRCRKCGLVAETKGDLQLHRTNCIVEVKCSVCHKHFLSRSQLKRHMRVHTGERPFQCNQCDLAFSQKEILVRHVMQIHTVEKPYACKICAKRFGMYRLLVTHYRLSHDDSKVFSCVLCPKVFKHPSGLSRHVQYHNGTRYYCKVCLKNFTDSSSVKRHVRLSHVEQYNDKNLSDPIRTTDEEHETITFMINDQNQPTGGSSSNTSDLTCLNN